MTLTWCSPGRQADIPRPQLATAGPPASTLDNELLKDGFERSFADAVLRANPLEINPALVETIDHADAGQRMLNSLRAEQRLPRVARHRLHPHGMANRFCKARGV